MPSILRLKSTRGNNFLMPEGNASSSNSEHTFTFAPKAVQELSHLFSGLKKKHQLFLSCSKTSSITETEEASIFILILQSEDRKEEVTAGRHPKSQKKRKHRSPDFTPTASTKSDCVLT